MGRDRIGETIGTSQKGFDEERVREHEVRKVGEYVHDRIRKVDRHVEKDVCDGEHHKNEPDPSTKIITPSENKFESLEKREMRFWIEKGEKVFYEDTKCSTRPAILLTIIFFQIARAVAERSRIIVVL